MMKLKLALAAGALLVSGTAHAALDGTTVNGTLTFNGQATNYFDPNNGFVPFGTGNSSGLPVTIGSGTEFGFDDTVNRDTADFTDTQLIIQDLFNSEITAPWTMTFTSDAFGSISLNSSSFDPNLTYALLANTITISYAGTFSATSGSSFRAVFDIGPAAAVPEPATWAMMLLGFAGIGLALGRKHGLAAAA